MGSIICKLSKKKPEIAYLSNLTLPLSLIQESYCNFRTICDDFIFDSQKLLEIFPKSDLQEKLHGFVNQDGLVNALELFCCLIVFSEDEFRLKADFLFDIFDFNHLNFLTVTDFEYMLHCVVSGVFKLFGINKIVANDEIAKLVKKQFACHHQIGVSNIVAFSVARKEIGQFFEIIERKKPIEHELSTNEKLFLSEHPESSVAPYLLEQKFVVNKYVVKKKSNYSAKAKITFSQLTKKKNELIELIVGKTSTRVQPKQSTHPSTLKLKWIFGFPVLNQFRSFACHATTNLKIVYCVESVVVLFAAKRKKQLFYVEHRNKVGAVAVSRSNGLCASAEESDDGRLHIWRIDELHTLASIELPFNFNAFFVSFLGSDRFVLCIGKRHNPPICVFDLSDKSIVLNSYMPQFLRSFSTVINFESDYECQMRSGFNLQCSFILSSQSHMYLYLFRVESRMYKQIKVDILADYEDDGVECCVALYHHIENLELTVFGNQKHFELVILVGLASGKLIQCRNMISEQSIDYKLLMKMDYPIKHIVFFYSKYFVLSTEQGTIHVFDYNQRRVILEFSLSDLGFRVTDARIKNIETAAKYTLLVLTWSGELIHVKLKVHKQTTPTAKLIDSIFAFPSKVTSMCLIKWPSTTIPTEINDVIYAAFKNSKVVGFSLKNKAPVDDWSTDIGITAIDSYINLNSNVVFAVGHAGGKIVVRFNFEVYFKSFECGSKVVCLKFAGNGLHLVAGCFNSVLYIFNWSKGCIFEFEPKQVYFQNEIAKSINFTSDNQSFIVTTNELKLYQVSLNGLKVELALNEHFIDLQCFDLNYCFEGIKTTMKTLISQDLNMVFSGEQEGVITVFNSSVDLEMNSATYYHGHDTSIFDLLLSSDNKFLFSISNERKSIFKWRVDVCSDNPIVIPNYPIESKECNCVSIIRPIIVCSNTVSIQTINQNSLAYFRGFSDVFLKNIFGNRQNRSEELKTFPLTNLKLVHVYGAEVYDLRNCVFYVSDVLIRFQYNIDVDKSSDIAFSTSPSTSEFSSTYSFKTQRYILYIAGRIAIVINPQSASSQKLYQGHCAKISAIAVHEVFRVVASGEAIMNPKIQIWHPFTLQTMGVIDTQHQLGILILEFSRKGNLVFSVSVDKVNSMQVSNWVNFEVEAFRNTSTNQITTLKINPSNWHKFTTGGRNSIDSWKIKGHSILHQCSINMEAVVCNHFITTLKYLSYKVNGKTKDDVLFGTSNGCVGLISNGRCVKVKSIVNDLVITCMCTMVVEKECYIFLASDNNYIRILDMSLTEVQSFQVNENETETNSLIGVNSFDLIFKNNSIFCVLGVKTGKIVEIELKLEVEQSAKLSLTEYRRTNIISFHAAQNYSGLKTEYDYIAHKSILIAIYPIYRIFASVGSDNRLRLFDFEGKVERHNMNLMDCFDSCDIANDLTPTCLKFLNENGSVVIGFTKGFILTMQLRFESDFEFVVSYELIKEQNCDNSIVNIVVSPKNTLMAISFGNKDIRRDEVVEEAIKSTAYIAVYQINKNTSFTKLRELRLASLNNAEVSKLSIFASAAYFMCFSIDEMHLMVYYQSMDMNRVRQNRDIDGKYMVWNHETAVVEMNWKVLKNLQFANNIFPNHCNMLRVIQDLDQNSKGNENVNCTISNSYKNNSLSNKIVISTVNEQSDMMIVLGSEEGELFVGEGNVCLLNDNDKIIDSNGNSMCQYKRFQAHCSFITQIECDKNSSSLFTTSISDECIFQWELSRDSQTQEQYTNIDTYEEIPTSKEFKNIQNDVYVERDSCSKIMLGFDLSVYPKYRLDLCKIIGRRAQDRRSNMCLTSNNQFIYTAGTMIVMTDIDEHNSMKQEFLIEGKVVNLNAPAEISCIEIAKDGRTMCMGTSESTCSLILWEVTSKCYIGKIRVPKCVSVLKIKFADDIKYLMCICLTRDYKLGVYYCSVRKQRILAYAVFDSLGPFRVKDCVFQIGKNNQFITIGLNHAWKWSFRGGLLNWRGLKYRESLEMNDVSLFDFLCIQQMTHSIFVTGCSKGFIYGWLKGTLITARMSYPKTPITQIAKLVNNDTDFLIGGFATPLLYYRLFQSNESSLELVPVFKVDLFGEKQLNPENPELQLQTLLWIKCGRLIYGTRSGNIDIADLDVNKIDRLNEMNMKALKNDDLSNMNADTELLLSTQVKFQFASHEVPRSVNFSKDLQRVLLLTEAGNFLSFDFKSLRLIKKIQFDMKANTMLVLSDMIILVFEEHIRVIESNDSYKLLTEYNKHAIAPINKAKANTNENMLAVSYYAYSDLQSKIEVFEIEDTFSKILTIETDEVVLLDFSVNNLYLMYQELTGKSFIVSVTLERLEVQALDNDDYIEWTGDGFHLKEKRKYIAQSYSDESDIVSIVKIGKSALAVSDHLGTVCLLD